MTPFVQMDYTVDMYRLFLPHYAVPLSCEWPTTGAKLLSQQQCYNGFYTVCL